VSVVRFRPPRRRNNRPDVPGSPRDGLRRLVEVLARQAAEEEHLRQEKAASSHAPDQAAARGHLRPLLNR
jgi:hypothetical protein